jgi:hypothetical protein
MGDPTWPANMVGPMQIGPKQAGPRRAWAKLPVCHIYCQPVKTFARMHHVCRPLMAMVVARSSSPPQHHHRKRPGASRSTTLAPQQAPAIHSGPTTMATPDLPH